MRKTLISQSFSMWHLNRPQHLCKDYKKDIFDSFAYDFELTHKSRRSRVYHQDVVLHIINSAGIVYHHCERILIHALRDDIQS